MNRFRAVKLMRNVNRKTFSSVSNENRVVNALNPVVTKLFRKYEDFIGITEVKQAQNKVIQAEKRFVDTQETRRERQRQIQQHQSKLKEIHLELDKTSRGEDRYLHLVTQEHSILREEKSLMDDFRALEKDERDYFSALSLAVRESHEQERTQAERTKYWSIIGSVCGAIIGILGTTFNNRLRMKELRSLVQESSFSSEAREIVANQQKQVDNFLKELNQINSKTKPSVTTPLLEPTKVYRAEDLSELSDIVRNVEKNLEWKMKINSLATVAAFYGVFVVLVPIIYQICK